MFKTKFRAMALALMLFFGTITVALACGPNFDAISSDGVEVVCCELGMEGGQMLLSCTDGERWFHAHYAQ